MTYFNWFKKLINILIELFFVAAILSTLYVFTSLFQGTTRIIIFIGIVIVFGLLVYFLRNKVKKILSELIKSIEDVDTKKLLLIIVIMLVVLKIAYSIFYSFDATQDGDIEIYNEIANQIVATGVLHSDAIAHLFGMAIHLALFKFINLPIHIGMFIVLSIGIIVNFFSFKDIIGKEKAFIVTMLYIIMPSTMFLTFCPTHEVFLFTYISLFIFIYNKLLKEEKLSKNIFYCLLSILLTVLACMINPSGYILWIIMGLSILLSKLALKKKIIVLIVLLLSILGTNLINKALEVDEHVTSLNTYTILIHGSNKNSLGEQVDGYPLREMRMYIKDVSNDWSDEGFLDAGKNVLINQYKDLLTHPIDLLKLIVHKTYILWSGNHYAIEMAYNAGALSNITYYLYLGFNGLIYLLVLTIGFTYAKKKDDEIYISNYKLVLLGCIAITLLSVVLNKYSLYVTMFIYLISFYKIDVDDNKH